MLDLLFSLGTLAALIVLNGVFSLAEIALATSSAARLRSWAAAGKPGAARALSLHERPTQYLSMVQVGITLAGLISGVASQAALAPVLEKSLLGWLSPALAAWLAALVTLGGITFLIIVLGELLPKRIAQIYPERTACLLAPLMALLTFLLHPFTLLLARSTDTLLHWLHIRAGPGRALSRAELAQLIEESAQSNPQATVQRLLRNVSRLQSRPLTTLMTPRDDIIWVRADAGAAQALELLREHQHSRLPVCRESLQEVIGFVDIAALLPRQGQAAARSVGQAALKPPVFVPETANALELLQTFRSGGLSLAFVIDEYGEIQGLVTSHDLLEAIAGEFAPQKSAANDEVWAKRQEDGTWLLDGQIPILELKDHLGILTMPEESQGRYKTLSGLLMFILARLPKLGDKVEWAQWRLSVTAMDGLRVDKVLAEPLPSHGPEGNEQTASGA